jgi:hypothetical protein
VSPGAALEPLANGAVRIVTGAAPWEYAVGFTLDSGHAGTDVFALVSCRRGEVGVGLLAPDGSWHVGRESLVPAGETRLLSWPADSRDYPARWLMVRNGAEATTSECDVLAAYTGNVPSVELTEEDIALALRDPTARANCARRTWPDDVLAEAGASGIPLRVEPPDAPLRLPEPGALWSDTVGSAVLRASEDLVGLLDRFRPEALERHVALLPKDAMRSYLRMNVVRVVRLCRRCSRGASTAGGCSRWAPGSGRSPSLFDASATTSPRATATPATGVRSTATSS